jgi:Reverse transcriptase (RNA-dependent DNA polymerase)
LQFSNSNSGGFSLADNPPPIFDSFRPASLDEVRKVIFSCSDKHCLLDAIPTFLLKKCFDVLGNLLTTFINLSLSEGSFPSSFSHAIVHPLLKKPSLNTEDLANYRPISNLNFISKLLERIVAKRIDEHLSFNSLYLPLQSAYRKFHSTETALLAIHNDIITAMDHGKVTALVLLDLSAAFDTVDHVVLVHRLEHWFGITGIALNWFKSYLYNRTQAVSIRDHLSDPTVLDCGVPQGSVLGPLLFTLYTIPLGNLLTQQKLNYHLYADDTQIFLNFAQPSISVHLELLSKAITSVQSWMTDNKLLLNPSKTEFLVFGTPARLKHLNPATCLSVGNSDIQLSNSARNLGVIFDQNLSFSKHIDAVCRSTHYHLRDLRRIRRILPSSALIPLANALVSCRLDYCNSLYSGIPITNLLRLQRIQNCVARVVTGTAKYEHITPVLKRLHWLPIKQRIDFKTSLLVHKSLHSGQPSYLRSLLTIHERQYSTRSLDALCLQIPFARTSLGKRAFSVAGPRLWNSLPVSVRSADSLSTFRSRLKTYLFWIAYPP